METRRKSSHLTNADPSQNGHKPNRVILPEATTDGPQLSRLSFNRIGNPRWVWKGRVIEGGLTGIAGDPGVGKGNLSARIMAGVTRGTLPGDLEGEPRAVIIVGDEDDLDVVWGPRLMAAGADEDLIFKVDYTLALSKLEHYDLLSGWIEDTMAALVFFDQITDNMPDTDANQTHEVRPLLTKLAVTAKATRSGMLMTQHPNRSGKSLMERIPGASAWRGVPRVWLSVVRDPMAPPGASSENVDRLLVHTKGNYTGEVPTFRYRIEEHVVYRPKDTGANGDPLDGARPVFTSHIVPVGGEDYVMTQELVNDLIFGNESTRKAARERAHLLRLSVHTQGNKVSFVKDGETEGGDGDDSTGVAAVAGGVAGSTREALVRRIEAAMRELRQEREGNQGKWVSKSAIYQKTKGTKQTIMSLISELAAEGVLLEDGGRFCLPILESGEGEVGEVGEGR